MTSGYLSGRLPKRYILAFIYSTRALTVLFLISMPASPAVAIIYGALTGLLWLSSVPPTSGLVAVMFGTRWLAMLVGIAFLSHQLGGSLGVYLGGLWHDYELLRNVVLSVNGGYETDKFFGQLRKDRVTSTDASVKYLLNRFAAISAFHRYTNRDSDIPAFSYDKQQVGINVTAQF